MDREGQEQRVDLALAIVATLFCLLVFLTAERTPDSEREADLLGALLVGFAPASLAVRRRWPLAVLAAASTATVTVYVLDYPDSGLPVVVAVALYTVAWKCSRRSTVLATAALLLVVVLVIADAGDIDGGTLVAVVAVYVSTAGFGDRRKLHDAYDEQVELRAAERERRQDEAARRAITDERLRIARELHDIVAHAMSVVAVQSGVGAHVAEQRPDEAKRILETISATSRGSLEEMRRLLGVLREEPAAGDDGADLTPAPGLAGLDELAAGVTGSGVPVTVVVQGEQAALPAGVDLAAYRIVQEALTNVLRHAGTAVAEVRVRYGDGCVHLEVVDDGRGAASGTCDPHPLSTGHGLVDARAGRAVRRDARGRSSPRRRLPRRHHLVERPIVIRVLLADDQALVRAGFRVLLETEPDLEVVGEANDGAEAHALAVSEQPDVVLMDIRMPQVDGIEATTRIVADERTADVRVLVLTTFDLDEYVFKALRAGASGFLLKDTQPTELLAAIRVVAAGEALLSPRITRTVIEAFAGRPDPVGGVVDDAALAFLTDREREVLVLIGRGLSNSEIGETLVIGAATTKTHVSRLLAKLHARDRAQLVVAAYESGLVSPGADGGPRSQPQG